MSVNGQKINKFRHHHKSILLYKRHILFFSLLLTAVLPAKAGSSDDSLMKIWDNRQLHDTVRFEALGKLSRNFSFSDPDSSLVLAQMLFKAASVKSMHRWMGSAQNTIGICYWVKGEFTPALEAYEFSLEMYEKCNNKKGMSNAYNNIGLIHAQQGNHQVAIKFLHKSLAMEEEMGNRLGVVMSFNNIAQLYTDQRNYPKALQYLEKSEALSVTPEFDDALANCYNIYGVVYYELKKYDTSLAYYNKSLEIQKKFKNEKAIAGLYINIGLIYREKKDYDESDRYFMESFSMNEKINHPEGVIASYSNLGTNQLRRNNFREAEKWCVKGLQQTVDMGWIGDEIFLCECLYKAYSGMGDHKKAYDFHVRYTALSDSLVNEEKLIEITQNEFQFEYAKKAAADSIRHEEQQKITKAELAASEAQLKTEQTQKYMLFGGIGLVMVFSLFIFDRFRVTRKQKKIIEIQKAEVETKQNEILDSIHYAKQIQNALMRDEREFSHGKKECFILFRPRDIVSGDFYWSFEKENHLYFAAADCTGHGVPGAFLTMLAVSTLNEITASGESLSPAGILDALRKKIVSELSQSGKRVARDGLDISLMKMDLSSGEIQWAGANNPLVIADNTGLKEIKGDAQPVGFSEKQIPFKNNSFRISAGSMVYLFTDGYADQFGGPSGKKMKKSVMFSLLKEIHHLPLLQQKNQLEIFFTKWKGNHEQVDDVCIIGIRQ